VQILNSEEAVIIKGYQVEYVQNGIVGDTEARGTPGQVKRNEYLSSAAVQGQVSGLEPATQYSIKVITETTDGQFVEGPNTTFVTRPTGKLFAKPLSLGMFCSRMPTS
jgi:hypothetical protein